MRRYLAIATAVFCALGCNGSTGATTAPRSATAPPSTTTTTPPVTTAPVPSTTAPATPPPATPPPAPGSSSGGSGGIAGVTPGQPSYGLKLPGATAAGTFDLYVPSTYKGAPVGVVLALHGVEGTPTPHGWFQLCALICNNDRFIVVAPWGDVNDGGSGAWTQPYAAEILDLVRQKYNVDLKRQYMAAISGGCLPGVFFALGTKPTSYTSVYGNYSVKAGFQADFAAVGFSAPAYSPSDPDFAALTGLDAKALGFTPALWTDYGSLSSNRPQADDLAAFASAHGYAPVEDVVRPNEGHPPQPPYTYEVQMFDLFAATKKP